MLQLAETPDAPHAAAPIEIVPQGATMMAEIRGLDFSKPLDQVMADAVRDALVTHKVICFRDAEMTPAQQLAFSRCLGEPMLHSFLPHLPDLPEIIVLDNHKDNPVFSTDVWHSDETFREAPPLGTVLRAMRVPGNGGDTLWADMNAAYEDLSATMQNFLSGLEAVHDFRNFRRKFDHLPPRDKHAKLAELEERYPNPTHPVVRTHPVSGQKVLFVNEQFTIAVKGMREDESQALLAFLFSLPRIPEHQVRFRWERNSMVVWDNRSTQHYASNDYYPQHRTMHRVSLKGDRPF